MMAEFIETAALTLVILAFVIGLFGLVVPLLPGMLMIWGAIAFYTFAVDQFTTVSIIDFVFLTLLALFFGTADLWLPLLGANSTGASWKTLLWGALGAIVGTFVVPVPLIGTIVGYMAGILIAEYIRHRALGPAIKSGFGGFVGWGLGTAVQLAGGVLIIVLFAKVIT